MLEVTDLSARLVVDGDDFLALSDICEMARRYMDDHTYGSTAWDNDYFERAGLIFRLLDAVRERRVAGESGESTGGDR